MSIAPSSLLESRAIALATMVKLFMRRNTSPPPIHWHLPDRCSSNNATGRRYEREAGILAPGPGRTHDHRTRQCIPEATRHPWGYPVLYGRYRHRPDAEYPVWTRGPDPPRENES